MRLFDRRAQPNLGRLPGQPALGDRIGVFIGGGEPFVRGYLLTTQMSADGLFICDPDREGGPFFATYRRDQIGRIDGDPIDTSRIITHTEDGLTPGAKVFIHIRERNDSGRGVFVCEFMGHRCVVFHRGGAATYPASDVVPHARPLSADDVLRMREVSGLGMIEAKRILQGRKLRQDLARARDVGDLRHILGEVLDQTHPQDHHTRRALDLFDRSA